MALFKKKSTTDASNGDRGGSGGGTGGDESDFTPQPEKARTWFEYARTASDAYNYEYSLTCYANGIKLDPESMSAHEAMYTVGVNYCRQGGKPASGKELKSIGDTHVVAKFAAAEFAWMKDVNNGSLALKALEAAIKANQLEFGNWAAQRVLAALAQSKKLSKSALLQARDLFAQVGAWDEAMNALQRAVQLDPNDSKLAAEQKDLAAQRAMDQGGYSDAAGKEGGFRDFIKDADKQRELIEEEAISQSESAEERVLNRSREEYEANPSSPDAINKYAQMLKKLGTPESVQAALDVYTKGFEATGEYRFRAAVGDIRIDGLKKAERELREQVAANADDVQAAARLKQAIEKRLEVQADEYSERVRKYPTDRKMKYDLGTVQIELKRYDEAMAQFQAAKDEPKLRVRAGYHLGRCFAAEGWHREAVGEFKECLEAMDGGDKDQELVIRYELMVALMNDARAERSIDQAKEALDICSGIARKDITFRDIRVRRKELDDLIKELG